MNVDGLVTLVTFGAQTSNFISIRTFNERLIFYESFCEGPSALIKICAYGSERVKEFFFFFDSSGII